MKESIGPGQDREFLVDGVEYLGGCDPEVRSFCFTFLELLVVAYPQTHFLFLLFIP